MNESNDRDQYAVIHVRRSIGGRRTGATATLFRMHSQVALVVLFLLKLLLSNETFALTPWFQVLRGSKTDLSSVNLYRAVCPTRLVPSFAVAIMSVHNYR